MLEEASTVPENLSSGTGNREQKDGDGGSGSVSVGFGEEERVGAEEGDRSWLGNRWPQQETLALLKIRSDMDVAFRDANLKAPLWEDVSRSVYYMFLLCYEIFSEKNFYRKWFFLSFSDILMSVHLPINILFIGLVFVNHFFWVHMYNYLIEVALHRSNNFHNPVVSKWVQEKINVVL